MSKRRMGEVIEHGKGECQTVGRSEEKSMHYQHPHDVTTLANPVNLDPPKHFDLGAPCPTPMPKTPQVSTRLCIDACSISACAKATLHESHTGTLHEHLRQTWQNIRGSVSLQSFVRLPCPVIKKGNSQNLEMEKIDGKERICGGPAKAQYMYG